MNDAASKEIPGLSMPAKENVKITHLPAREITWLTGVAQSAQQAIKKSFTIEHATPPASQPLPNTTALQQVQAVRVDAEPVIDIADARDILEKTARHAVESVGGDKGLSARIETTPGFKGVSFAQEKARKLSNLRRQQDDKAA